MSYNLTLGVNSTFYDFAYRANEFSSGFLVGGFMLAFFVLMILILGDRVNQNFAAGMAISGFLSFVVSLFFAVSELLNFYFPIGFATVAAFATLYLYLEGK